MKLNVVKNMYIWFGISLLILLPGLIALFLGGLKLGIDFTGGSIIELRVNRVVTVNEITNSLTSPKYKVPNMDPELFKGAKISLSKDENIVYIRSKHLTVEQQNAAIKLLEKEYGKITVERIESVGPSIGTELGNKALIAVVLVLGGIFLYTAYSFRWDYSICILLCLAHDVLACVGIFALLGLLFGIEIDSLFVTGVLSNAGYSVHDTIVVFDRIRENMLLATKGQKLEDIIETSVHQTFVRSINTSLTSLITLFTLFFFGGESIRYFVLVLIIGIVVGTFSSIFVASPLFLLVRKFIDNRRKQKRLATT